MEELNYLSAFDYELPDHLIALEPLSHRSDSRLLVYSENKIIDSQFNLLFEHLKPNDHLIFNDTLVLAARLSGIRARKHNAGVGNAKVEVLLNEPISENQWTAFCKPLRKLKETDEIIFSENLSAEVVSVVSGQCVLKFSKSGMNLDSQISILGQLPLPPYIIKKRSYKETDTQNYQSIFARSPGAIASPTASLHFEQNLLNTLKSKGVKSSFVTLHVGPGTFLPIKTENIAEHKMHSERGIINKTTVAEVNETLAKGGRIIPVGTTSLRLIETAANSKNFLSEFNGRTDIFIKPGYKFKICSGLITNFHFPKSTLLMLIAAFVGNSERKKIYSHAIRNEYRFFSYGDSSLLLPKSNNDP